MIILELFFLFLKIGTFSFGGGYGMISLLQHEVVSRNYLTTPEFVDIVAISQITPGPIAVNMATFVGFRQAGVLGALISTAGVCIPSLLMVLLALKFLDKFKSLKTVDSIFYGLRPTVAALILSASIQISWLEFFPSTTIMAFDQVFNNIEFKSIFICIAVLIAVIKFKISPIVMIFISAIVGIFVF